MDEVLEELAWQGEEHPAFDARDFDARDFRWSRQTPEVGWEEGVAADNGPIEGICWELS